MNKWLEEIYEKVIYEKRLMSAKELDNWELSLWHETFKTMARIEVYTTVNFAENGMYLDKDEIKRTVRELEFKLEDEAKTHKHSSLLYKLCWNCLEHILVYWT